MATTISGNTLEKQMSQSDLKALSAAGAKYNSATTQAEKDAAHAEAEAIRNKYGYSSTSSSGATVTKTTIDSSNDSSKNSSSGTKTSGASNIVNKVKDNIVANKDKIVSNYTNKTSADVPSTTTTLDGNVYKVGDDGKAPAGLSVGDYVVTAGGTYQIKELNSDGTYKNAEKVNSDITTANYTGKYNTINDTANKTEIIEDGNAISKIPDDAVAVGIFSANGGVIGTGYIVNGKTYLKNADGSGTRLTNDSDNPIVVRTQGGDYVLSNNFGGSVDDYNKQYGMLPYQTKYDELLQEEETTQTTPVTVDYNTMDLDEIYDQLMNAINNNDTGKIEDILTWAEAMAISTERNNPLYDKALDDKKTQYTNKALNSGFYGQLPVDALWTQAIAANEGDRTQAIIDYATQLYNESRDDANELYSMLQDERESKIDALLNILNYASDYNYNMAKLNADNEEKQSTISKTGKTTGTTADKVNTNKTPKDDGTSDDGTIETPKDDSTISIPDGINSTNTYRVDLTTGNAPEGMKVGEYVVTGGGIYQITAVNADGTYKSKLITDKVNRYNYESLGGKYVSKNMNELNFATLHGKVKNALDSGNITYAYQLYKQNYNNLSEIQKDKLTLLIKEGASPYSNITSNTITGTYPDSGR